MLEEFRNLLINKMKGHDWWYEYSEDQKARLKGLEERYEIYRLFTKIPPPDREALVLEFVPGDAQKSFVEMLTYFNKSMTFIGREI